MNRNLSPENENHKSRADEAFDDSDLLIGRAHGVSAKDDDEDRDEEDDDEDVIEIDEDDLLDIEPDDARD